MPSRRRRFRSRPKPQVTKPLANEEIKVPQVRLVGVDGAQLGVVDRTKALELAQTEGVDLVIVAGKADPPVARLMDVGKHMYEKRKQDAKQRARGKSGGMKGVRLGFKTDDHDWKFRLDQAADFINEGNKVKVEMRLRGREKQRGDLAEQKIRQFVGEIPTPVQIEGNVSRSVHTLTAVVTKA